MKKKILCIVMAIVFATTGMPGKVEAASKYGFSYDTSAYKVKWSGMYSFNVFTDKGTKLGTCSYVVGLARDKGTNNYILMTREVMTPNNSKVKIDNYQYGYGFSEYVSAKVTLPSLDDYEPQNTPAKDSINFSIGADKSGASVGASYSITHSDMDITAACNTAEKKYYIKYNYKPSLVNPLANNKYLANESIQLGAAAFHKAASEITFTMQYDARFGAAENNAASPLLVFYNYVKKATKSKTITLTVNEK